MSKRTDRRAQHEPQTTPLDVEGHEVRDEIVRTPVMPGVGDLAQPAVEPAAAHHGALQKGQEFPKELVTLLSYAVKAIPTGGRRQPELRQ